MTPYTEAAARAREAMTEAEQTAAAIGWDGAKDGPLGVNVRTDDLAVLLGQGVWRLLNTLALFADEWDRWQRKGSPSTERMVRFSYGKARIGLSDFKQARTLLAAAPPLPAASSNEAAIVKRCGASPDHADILETIENAADNWKDKGYASALAEVRDMANVGRALMEALPEGYHYNDCPSEIVSDLQIERDEAVAATLDEAAIVERLRSEIINTPETADFMAGVPIEAAHQPERWGSDHDAGKTPFDWFWLIGYLAQKAAEAAIRGDAGKAKHHTISTAAALANWHAALAGGDDRMRPGIMPPAAIQANHGMGDLTNALTAAHDSIDAALATYRQQQPGKSPASGEAG